MQNTEGEGGQNFIGTALSMYRTFGLGVFWDGKSVVYIVYTMSYGAITHYSYSLMCVCVYLGITPKCLRAAVNHSITFFVYDYIMRHYS